jgi:hypothetical protein
VGARDACVLLAPAVEQFAPLPARHPHLGPTRSASTPTAEAPATYRSCTSARDPLAVRTPITSSNGYRASSTSAVIDGTSRFGLM